MYSFWAKYEKNDDNDGDIEYHHLLSHMIDVMAVSKVLMEDIFDKLLHRSNIR